LASLACGTQADSYWAIGIEEIGTRGRMDSLPTKSLQKLRAECRDVVNEICERLACDSHASHQLRSLVASPDMLADFVRLAKSDPDSSGLILRAAIAALVNAQSVMVIDAELMRRAEKN
jgi:hypothetical protein